MVREEWWRGAVIYQIYPRSFCDSNGDGIGDLRGIAQRLDHIAELGVDAVWIAPFFASPMKDFGYDVSDYCAVDPTFGTLADFDALLTRAHALGLKVIIDQVWSHTSDQHAWFADSRLRATSSKADWYVWADPRPDGSPPNNWLSVFGGGAWTWEPRRRQYYLHHFLPSQPSLNLRNPAVWDALFDVASFWLDRGVDGFRLDAVDFMLHDRALRDNPARPPVDGQMPLKPFRLQAHAHDMMQPEIVGVLERIRRFMDRYPDTVTLGEVSSEPGSVERCGIYTGGDGQRLHMAYTLGLLKREFSSPFVRRAIAEAEAADVDGWLCWAFGNHDVERVVSRWSGGKPTDAFARLLTALQLSLRGSLCIYQGEELGLPEADLAFDELRDPYGIAFYPEFRGRDGCRTPMPWQADAAQAGFTAAAQSWLPVPASHRVRAVDRQRSDRASVLNGWQRFLAWRKRHPALIHGDLRLIDTPDPLVCFERSTRGERVVAVFNLSDQPVTLPPDLLRPGLRMLDGHGFAHERDRHGVILPPHGALFAAESVAAAPVRVLEPAE
ncbi:MAG: alpha-glucosidase [Alphaproteobacteria bacterium]|nr:alpha-glucosidase [Alphaproteobacteria bacterium]